MARSTKPRTLRIVSYGVVVEIESPDELTRELEACLPPGWAPTDHDDATGRVVVTPAGGDTYSVTHDDLVLSRPLSRQITLDIVDSQVRSIVAVHAHDRAFVHAGVVAVGDRAIVVPGNSFAGKTSLVEALLRQGAVYYSDEYAVLTPDGGCLPFPKPLSIRSRDWAARTTDRRAVETPAAELGARTGEGPVRIGLIAALRYVPGEVAPPQTRTAAQGALLLLSHALAGRSEPARVLPIVRRAAAEAEVIEGTRGDADATAAALLERLG